MANRKCEPYTPSLNLAHLLSLLSNTEMSSFPLLPPKPSRYSGMHTLILDLDDTLIHSSIVSNGKKEVLVPILLDHEIVKVYVHTRPGFEEFIYSMTKLFEVIIFTASIKAYASPIIDHLDSLKQVSNRLYRDHCVHLVNGYVKYLDILGRDLNDVVIVDDTPSSYCLNKDNAVPIAKWIGDDNDSDLYRVMPILEEIAKSRNVRDYIRTKNILSYDVTKESKIIQN